MPDKSLVIIIIINIQDHIMKSPVTNLIRGLNKTTQLYNLSKMLTLRLSGADVKWRCMAALIPVRALGVSACPFSVLTSA